MVIGLGASNLSLTAGQVSKETKGRLKDEQAQGINWKGSVGATAPKFLGRSRRPKPYLLTTKASL